MKIQPKIFKSTIFRIFISLFPAQAGVIPVQPPMYKNVHTFPRASGGDPHSHIALFRKAFFSPRKRG